MADLPVFPVNRVLQCPGFRLGLMTWGYGCPTVLIRELADGREQLAGLWAAGTVSAHPEDRKVAEHPSAGPLRSTATC
jgi:hypothetical protein